MLYIYVLNMINPSTMKQHLTILLIAISLALFTFSLPAQTYVYKLISNLEGDMPEAPALEQIPNNNGLTGDFVTRSVPLSTCEDGGTAGGYYFEDDAGLKFICPDGFISESYSLSMIFQIDEFISPPPWVRVLSFTHTNDHGIYIYLSNPPDHGTLEFWPNGTVGTVDFFDTDNFYHLILVREATGLIRVYINGTAFAEYDDSGTQEYKFHVPDNHLIFFRDHPSVLADEASPGFVSNIKITNQAWSESQVMDEWEAFCPSLFGMPEAVAGNFTLYPNPVRENLFIHHTLSSGETLIRIYNLTGKEVMQLTARGKDIRVDTGQLPPGLYLIRISGQGESALMKFVKE